MKEHKKLTSQALIQSKNTKPTKTLSLRPLPLSKSSVPKAQRKRLTLKSFQKRLKRCCKPLRPLPPQLKQKMKLSAQFYPESPSINRRIPSLYFFILDLSPVTIQPAELSYNYLCKLCVRCCNLNGILELFFVQKHQQSHQPFSHGHGSLSHSTP